METMWIRFVAVSSTFLGLAKCQNVKHWRGARGLGTKPSWGGEVQTSASVPGTMGASG